MSKPADLVQGTLDLLLLKIVALEPLHAWAISQRLKQVSGDVLQVSDGPFTLRSTSSNKKGGSKPNGRLRKTADVPNSIHSHDRAVGRWSAKPQTGSGWQARFLRSFDSARYESCLTGVGFGG